MTTQELIKQGRSRGASAIRVKLNNIPIASVLVDLSPGSPIHWECSASRWTKDILFNSNGVVSNDADVTNVGLRILFDVTRMIEKLLPFATIEFHIEGKWI